MVHCYATENDGITITNCADKKAYFVLINGNVSEVWCGMDLNGMGGFSSQVYDGDVVQVYETIDECESDDYDEIVAWTNELLSELGEAGYAEDWLDENCILLGSITVPDPIGFDTNPVATVTWTINNKEVQSLTINNKEVQSIVRANDNVVLYVKSSNAEPVLSETITVNSVTFQQGKAGNMYMFNLTLENLDPNFYYRDNINSFRGVTNNNSTYTYDTGQFGNGPSTLPFTYILYKGNNYLEGDECARITITSATPPYTS